MKKQKEKSLIQLSKEIKDKKPENIDHKETIKDIFKDMFEAKKSEKALCFDTGIKGESNIWLPISQIEVDGIEQGDLEKGEALDVNIPDWLAEKHNL